MEPLVQIDRLSVHFPVKGRLPFQKKKFVRAVSDVSLAINPGEAFGLVGESGCGKSTLANAVLGMLRPTGGRVLFKGKDINALKFADFKALRRDMQMIFQDPFSSLNPRFTAYEIIAEPMRVRGGMTAAQREARVAELLHLVGLSKEDMCRYPLDFSGGQRQRIGIARAIALNPEFLVCDEPVSALDVSVHAQILNLLMDLQRDLHITYLFISHNLAVVKDICASVAVMYLGAIMETGPTAQVFSKPLHPYTRSLLTAVLTIDLNHPPERVLLKGDIPSPIHVPEGCPFCTRCPFAKERCHKEKPLLREMEPGHFAACHFAG